MDAGEVIGGDKPLGVRTYFCRHVGLDLCLRESFLPDTHVCKFAVEEVSIARLAAPCCAHRQLKSVADAPAVEVAGVLDVAFCAVTVQCDVTLGVADDHRQVHPCASRAGTSLAPVGEDIASAYFGSVGGEVLRRRAASPHLITGGLLASLVHVAACDKPLSVDQLVHVDPASDAEVLVKVDVEVSVRRHGHILVFSVELKPIVRCLGQRAAADTDKCQSDCVVF